MYFKVSQVEFSKLLYISVPEDCFSFSKQDPDYAAFYLGIHCLPKYLLWGFPYTTVKVISCIIRAIVLTGQYSRNAPNSIIRSSTGLAAFST